MTWRRIKCSSCGKELVIESLELEHILRTQYKVNCAVLHCPGMMSPIGRPITRSSTASRSGGYAFQVNRNEIRRNERVNYAQLADEEEQSDEEVDTRPSKKRKMDTELDAPGPKKRRKIGDDEDDDDYAPSEQYTPAMRFTDEDMESGLRLSAPNGLLTKSSGRVSIKAAISGEREKSTNNQMNGDAAWSYARGLGACNSGEYALGARNYYEWCHLQGVSLGGSTVAANLIAGHYAVNTYMSVVEECLRGKTALQIEVVAHAVHANVADFIVYSIYKASDGKLVTSIAIDGHMTYFSSRDRDRVRQGMKSWGI